MSNQNFHSDAATQLLECAVQLGFFFGAVNFLPVLLRQQVADLSTWAIPCVFECKIASAVVSILESRHLSPQDGN